MTPIYTTLRMFHQYPNTMYLWFMDDFGNALRVQHYYFPADRYWDDP